MGTAELTRAITSVQSSHQNFAAEIHLAVRRKATAIAAIIVRVMVPPYTPEVRLWW